MKYLLFFLLPTFALAESGPIIVEDTVYECSERLPEDIFEGMKNLSNLYTVDNIPKAKKNKMKLLGVTLLDMIQSKQRPSVIDRPGSLSNIDLLIVLRPLPKKVVLPKEYLPRFIIQCSTFQKSSISSLKCTQTNPEKAFGIDSFDMTLSIRKHPKAKKSCPTQVVINYRVEIDKADFRLIKDKSFDLMGTKGFVKIIGNLFANPKLFFKTYWEGFYYHWISAST